MTRRARRPVRDAEGEPPAPPASVKIRRARRPGARPRHTRPGETRTRQVGDVVSLHRGDGDSGVEADGPGKTGAGAAGADHVEDGAEVGGRPVCHRITTIEASP